MQRFSIRFQPIHADFLQLCCIVLWQRVCNQEPDLSLKSRVAWFSRSRRISVRPAPVCEGILVMLVEMESSASTSIEVRSAPLTFVTRQEDGGKCGIARVNDATTKS